MRKDVSEMCNLGEGIEERGIKKGFERGMEQGIERGNMLAIQRLLSKKMDNDFILSLGYTQDEIDEAEKNLVVMI